MELLEKENFVDEVSIFGNNMHIAVNDKYTGEEEIKRILSEKNSIRVKRIDRIVPTLEDVFIHLLEKDKK
jgi:ABC-2 type transport system ATP-binding protein